MVSFWLNYMFYMHKKHFESASSGEDNVMFLFSYFCLSVLSNFYMLMFVVIKCYFKNCMKAKLLNLPSKPFPCYPQCCISPACSPFTSKPRLSAQLPLTSAHPFPPTPPFNSPLPFLIPFFKACPKFTSSRQPAPPFALRPPIAHW